MGPQMVVTAVGAFTSVEGLAIVLLKACVCFAIFSYWGVIFIC